VNPIRRITMRKLLSILLLSAVVLVIAPVLAPMLQAQPPGPPTTEVEVVAPLPLPVDANVSGSVDVNNFPATQTVAGTVEITNLPLPVESSADNLRDGWGQIDLNQPYERLLEVPMGVAMTDAVVERFYGDDDECAVWFYRIEEGGMGPMITLRPSVDNPIVELHFESGLRSTEEREIGFFVNSDCHIYVLWTGYEY
jgi:hypothetical protein